ACCSTGSRRSLLVTRPRTGIGTGERPRSRPAAPVMPTAPVRAPVPARRRCTCGARSARPRTRSPAVRPRSTRRSPPMPPTSPGTGTARSPPRCWPRTVRRCGRGSPASTAPSRRSSCVRSQPPAAWRSISSWSRPWPVTSAVRPDAGRETAARPAAPPALVQALALVTVIAACSAEPAEPDRPELTVFVAASLADVAEQVSEQTGLDVTISAAGSSDLVSQVVSGAPADVLVTADEATMARAEEEGVVEEPRPVAVNHPALVVPAGNPAGITGLDDSLHNARLVICAPQVPCGAAAHELANLAGVDLQPVSEEPDVTDVLGSVTSGQ